ncbi:MAG TPA: DUF3151 domain-containing protein [Propionibacteriaceae bacterium]|nr:DUF3151 domain-containing protein [Propionibacteriaceae bacterium]
MTQHAAHQNLLASSGAGPAPTLLPPDPAAAELAEDTAELAEDTAELAEDTAERVLDVVAANPTSSLCWALLAERSLALGSREGDVAAYAYARTGYHRGLDLLRRSGWKGAGPIPWEHAPNRGFLRALWALTEAAGRIGDTVEQERCAQFLRDSSETAYAQLAAEPTV